LTFFQAGRMNGQLYRNMVLVPDMHVFFQTQNKGNALAFQPTHPALANKLPVPAQTGNRLIRESLVQPSHQVGTFPGIGISRLVEQDPKQRNSDLLMDDA